MVYHLTILLKRGWLSWPSLMGDPEYLCCLFFMPFSSTVVCSRSKPASRQWSLSSKHWSVRFHDIQDSLYPSDHLLLGWWKDKEEYNTGGQKPDPAHHLFFLLFPSFLYSSESIHGTKLSKAEPRPLSTYYTHYCILQGCMTRHLKMIKLSKCSSTSSHSGLRNICLECSFHHGNSFCSDDMHIEDWL